MSNNPFSGALVERGTQNAISDSEQSRAIAETQAAMVIAKKFPRNPVDAMDRILNACTRPTLAEGSLYTYARGGTDITGPSIRLAEAIAQNWGNIQFGIRELEQRNGESTVEAFAWDVETNTRQVKVFQVRHERHTKQGSKKLTDPRDIYELVANQGARRLRACILGVIPGDVVEAAIKQCETTLKTKAEVTPERISALLTKFHEYGISKAQIEKRIQRRVDAMTPAQLVSLGKIYNSLKDGMSVASDWFDAEETTKVEKPDFSDAGQQADELDKTMKPKKAPKSAQPTPEAASAQEGFVADTPQKKLQLKLAEFKIREKDFLDTLAEINPDSVKGVWVVSDMKDTYAQSCIDEWDEIVDRMKKGGSK